MSANAVASGTYSDLKIVKSRNVCQVVIEIPLETSARFVEMFGMPQPGGDVHVAIARLAAAPEGASASPVSTGSEYRQKALKLAGMLPSQRAFQRWIHGYAPGKTCPVDQWPEAERIEATEEEIRLKLGVKSRRELAESDDLCTLFYRIVNDYETACGRRVA